MFRKKRCVVNTVGACVATFAIFSAGSIFANPSKEFDEAIKKCQTTDTCLERAQQFAEENPNETPKLEIAAKFIRRQDEAGAARVYQKILLKDGAEKTCSRGDVGGATMQGLRSQDANAVTSAVAIANTCYVQLADRLKKALSDRYEPYMRNVCPIMRKNKALSGLHLKRCAKFP